MLPKKNRYVNVFCLTVSAPNLKEVTKHERKWITIYEEDKRI